MNSDHMIPKVTFPSPKMGGELGSLQMNLAYLLHRRVFSDVKRHSSSTKCKKDCIKYSIILIFKNKYA